MSQLVYCARSEQYRTGTRASGAVMTRNSLPAILVFSLAGVLAGCAAMQDGENVLQMADSISHLREVQVLRNISAAISDHDMVPSQVILGTGQANVQVGFSSLFKLPQFDFSRPSRQLDAGATDVWIAQWQMEPITNADDLRRLRNLYVLVASTDEDYDKLQAYLRAHPDRLPLTPETPELARGKGGSGKAPPVGLRWTDALQILKHGDSIGCKYFQEDNSRHGDRGLPFRRWLYWRQASGSWLPNTPDAIPQSLGHYGDWEIGITSRACFNDFVIMMQSATPVAEQAISQGPKVMLR